MATRLAVRSGCCGQWGSRAATASWLFRNSPQRPRLLSGSSGSQGRIGLSARSALVGGLLFASLPLVALQAPTAYNDLVVASFLVIAAYASIGRGPSELVLLTLAIALALTTKFTGILALPVLALVAGAANPIRRWPALAGAGLAGIALGSPWYIVNRVETGQFDGALTDATAQVPRTNPDRDRPDDPAGAVLLRRLLRDTRDRPVSGAVSVHPV